MRFNSPKNWDSNFQHDGLLYFTQRIEEMLFYYSSHLYRTPVLNTELLIDEYIETVDLVKQNAINSAQLKYIMEEFQDTFANDIIVQKNIEEEQRLQILHRLNQASQENQERIMRYLKRQFTHYNSWCKKYLEDIVIQPKEKKKIEKALKCYIPGLIGAGYSHEFIYHYNKQVFSTQKVNSLNSLYTFLDRFDFSDRQYDVYVAIKKEALAFKKILKDNLGFLFGEEANATDFRYDSSKYCIIKRHITALDEQAAAAATYAHLDLFLRYYKFIGNQNDDWLFPIGKVVDDAGNHAFLPLRQNEFDFSKDYKKSKIGNLSAAIIGLLISKSQNSFQIINQAVDTHNTAISETDLRNGFLNLWSILEMLFVSDHEDSKINEIEQKCLPITMVPLSRPRTEKIS